jgi:hypothetical protein
MICGLGGNVVECGEPYEHEEIQFLAKIEFLYQGGRHG